MFGPDLLVALVLYEGAREVYLPAGTTGKDAWTDEGFRDGQTITADAPLKHMPLYQRDEKVLSMKA
jgi:alpha-D-xyloside xylohydrolase